jgi:hypothetical protein
MALVLLTLNQIACDSGEPVKTETDALVGTWAITGFVDDTGDRSEVISTGFEGVHLGFAQDGTGTFTITPKGRPARLVRSTYSLDERVDLITLDLDVSEGPARTLELTYILELPLQRARFHTTQSDVLNWIFESELSGAVMILASKFGEDGLPE